MRTQWLVLCVACALAACSRQEVGWRTAHGEDSVAAYEAYLEQFPAGAHAAKARMRIRELQQDREWARANQLATPEAYQRYLGAYPEGRYARAARDRLSDFVLARAPPPEPVADAAAAAGRAAADPSAVPPADRAYAVQLGAYSSEAAARSELGRLSREHADLLEGLELRIMPPAAATPRWWRLRGRPLGEAAARELCAELTARRVGCVPAAE